VTAVDTNVLVRLFTADDARQFQKARRLFSDQDIFIPDTVLLETEWVLRFAYKFDTAAINGALVNLLGLPNVRVTRPELIAKALEWHRQGLDFADALHLAASQGHECFMTFDAKLVRKAGKLSNCRVEQP